MDLKNSRNYEADSFDWNEQEEAVHDQSAVEDVEKLLRTALTATVSDRSDYWIKPSAVDNDRARIAYNVPYALNETQKEHMQEIIGDVRTLTFNATGYHDHPISHCLTEISEDLVVRKFGNEPFVAIWGNASRHARFGHSGAKVVGSRVVPHDWFRNRGVEEAVTPIDGFVESRGHLKYRLFLATHALYYMSLDDVAIWLGGNRDAEFHAIIHRHDKTHGYLNKGELKYTVDSNGYVKQTNPLTGFKYAHRSMEPLFHADSCRLFDGTVGLSWDINRLAGDMYQVKFVLCDPTNCAKLEDPWMLINKDREVFARGDVTVYRCLSYKWYVYHDNDKRVLLEDVDLYDRLRRTVAGKERTPRVKSDLMAMCRRLANKNDIISIHQGFAHEVPPELMADYVNAAFYADVKHELEVALAYHKENRHAVDALNKFILEGIAPTDFTLVGKVGKAVVAPFQSLGGLLQDHSLFNSSCSGPPISISEMLPVDPFGRGVNRTDRREMIAELAQRLKAPDIG